MSSPLMQRSTDRLGSALIIVLALIVLLTGVVVAFFVRALNERQISNSSVIQTKIKLFAEGAADTIISDLKLEIAAGSSGSSVMVGTTAVTFYIPNASTTVVPALALAGTSGINTFAPNLVKRSAYKQPFYSGKSYGISIPAPDRAAPVSCLAPSVNGRAIPIERWNKALLLPKSNPASDTDATPLMTGSSAFVSPDWILVGRDGSNPTTLNSATNSHTAVVGRYAYAIYDTGGLLDANVAGYPASVLSATAVASKSSLAFADLTQLTGSDGAPLIKSSEIETLVGWRNYASAGASGSIQDGYSFSSGSSYYQYALANTKGFLTVSGSYNGQSDRMFIGRQQLIDFFANGVAKSRSDRARLQNALQYLGTFSRDINQPCFTPDPLRPKALSRTSADHYAGNDAAGHDDEINPAFLSLRVASTFPRNDGSTAWVGEPLVKKRFALNRLAWLTFKGPSASRNLDDADMKALLEAGISSAFLKQGDEAAIKKYFGLTWKSEKGYWVYDHGILGSVGQPIIGYLLKIRNANREPDFFELLKASINAGSLAKGATDPVGTLEEQNAFNYDTKLDYAIFQIAANIIDQFDTDGYPTRIRFNDGGKDVEFRGIENLPYYYRIRPGTVVCDLPNPAPLKDSYPYSFYVDHAEPWTSPSSLTKTGFYCVLWEPEIWNPHDVNSRNGNPRPDKLRIVADSAPLDADGNASDYNDHLNYTLFKVKTSTTSQGIYFSYDLDTERTPNFFSKSNPKDGVRWQGSDTALTFTDNGGILFREPTLLSKAGIPAGSNLALGSENFIRTRFEDALLQSYAIPSSGSSMQGIKGINDLGTSGTGAFVGFYFGQGPLRWVGTGTNVFSANLTSYKTTSNNGGTASTFRMQYSPDGGTTWITYDEKYVPHLRQALLMKVCQNGDVDKEYNATAGWITWMGCADPRSSRFGSSGGGSRNILPMYALSSTPLGAAPNITTPPAEANTVKNATASFWVDFANNVLMSDRWGTSSGYGRHDDGQMTGLPCVGGWYPAPSQNWLVNNVPSSGMHYRPGLLSQNNPAALSNGLKYLDQIDAVLPQYYTDPDGVVRRAMGAYVPTSSTAPATTTVGLPMARTAGVGAAANQSQSRPMILNRPFRSVAELGYVFSGTPWKNLSMFTPESGDAALLDVFCIQSDDTPDAVVAGKINLNTRQKQVVQAVLCGAYTDELNPLQLSGTDAKSIADALLQRTSDNSGNKGPLGNLSEVVGRWKQSVSAVNGGIDGGTSYNGFSGDLNSSDQTMNNIQRYRESAIRALSNAGTTRTWTLMIDLIAQTGRYPSNPQGLEKFIVEGERRYWIHLAIDRYSGRIIDQQLEVVRE